jgi:poly(hydroxyalkanoate) depolymerase family esterase
VANIADNISRLSMFRGGLHSPRKIVAGDRLADLDDFGSNPGQLRARLFVPKDLAPGAPLVVVLHGCTQNAAGYDLSSGWSKLADEHGFAVLFPEQRQSNNPNLCFNWFLPQHSRRGSGEALSIKEMIDTVRARHAVDADRIFVTGLSAGGAMASVMLATYPDVFAGGAIIAGLPYGVATSVPTALQLMGGRTASDPVDLMSKVRSASSHKGSWPKVSVWHGTADPTVNAANARATIDQWRLIHDVPAEPSQVEMVNGFQRRSWRNGEGREVIEEYMIPGMAHGTPLDTRSGTGTAGAFMLDVGICSTQEMLRFWGLTAHGPSKRQEKSGLRMPTAEKAVPGVALLPAEPRPQRTNRLEPQPKVAAPTGVGKIIEDALRAAGLMK